MGPQVSHPSSHSDLIPTASAMAPAEGQAAQMPFRFLDLPPEVRNQIYDIVSQQVDEIPISIFNKKRALREASHPGRTNPFPLQRVLDRFRTTAPELQRRRYALAQTCRQIRREARLMLPEPSRLDLQYLMLKSSLKEMYRLTDPPKSRYLQLIRHIDIDFRTWQYFLIHPSSLYGTLYWERGWENLYESKKASANAALKLLNSLDNVESITIHDSYMAMSNDHSTDGLEGAGLKTINDFESRSSRKALKAFPRLSDVKYISPRAC